MSTDGSREIAARYAKVSLIENNSEVFSESERQKLLINAARNVSCLQTRKLIFALDADECLSANFKNSLEWQTILLAEPGTVVKLNWTNIHPNFRECWQPKWAFPIGFMDDGKTDHQGHIIHSDRIPILANSNEIICQDIKLLHYQYVDWERMQSKHRWYQCFELLHRQNLRPLSIFRGYHHMYSLPKSSFQPIEETWFNYYEANGIDMRQIKVEKEYWWDLEIEKYFIEYDRKYFACLSIWEKFSPDPRTSLQKLIHAYLNKTQPFFQNQGIKGIFIRQFDKLLIHLL